MTIKNKTLTMLELSNELQAGGFSDIFENGNMREILDSGIIIVNQTNNSDEARVEFKIVEWNDDLLNVVVKITDIYPI